MGKHNTNTASKSTKSATKSAVAEQPKVAFTLEYREAEAVAIKSTKVDSHENTDRVFDSMAMYVAQTWVGFKPTEIALASSWQKSYALGLLVGLSTFKHCKVNGEDFVLPQVAGRQRHAATLQAAVALELEGCKTAEQAEVKFKKLAESKGAKQQKSFAQAVLKALLSLQ